MKKNSRLIATLLLMIALVSTLCIVIKNNNTLERTYCFHQLTGYTKQIAGEILQNVQLDRTYLEKISNLLAKKNPSDVTEMQEMLSSLGGAGLVSRLDLLLPGNKLITGTEGLLDAPSNISFETEAALGIHISGRLRDPLQPDKWTVRHYVPVEQDGHVVSVLCGVIMLDSLPFSVDGFQNQMQLYLMEGKSGDYLMDTWHNDLGNMEQFRDRLMQSGYSAEQIQSDFANGKPGTIVSFSRTASEYFYACYAPVGMEDWMVMVTVPEHVAFAHAETILTNFYILSGLLLLFFTVYFLWILRDIRREKEQNEKRLQTIQYILDVESELFSAYFAPEHFSTALKRVSDFLTAETAFLWLLDEQHTLPCQCHFWSRAEEEAATSWLDTDLSTLFPNLCGILSNQNGILSYDMSDLSKICPVNEAQLSSLPIRNLMLIRVDGVEGELCAILGACNMEHRWPDTEPLQQVSLSFSMAINHYDAYLSVTRMGRVDSLTGLLNCNSYHATLDALPNETLHSLACLYIDANGLHEINNHLGHQAGDEMLKTIAATLQDHFSETDVYRIGGDEFVVLCRNLPKEAVYACVAAVRQTMSASPYTVSMGVEWRDCNIDPKSIILSAEAVMQREKQQYYQGKGGLHRNATAPGGCQICSYKNRPYSL
ncbi:MAG: GGDEF domain-containing protein [Oscillospiraceae bacterium]